MSDSRDALHREQRRHAVRLRRAGAVGASVLAGAAAMFAGYAGNPRLPRAYAAASCTVTDLGSSGEGTLRDCITDVDDGGTITVPEGTIELADPDGALVINKSLTIVGAGRGRTIIDANGTAETPRRVIEAGLVEGESLVVSDVTVTGGWADGPGGAILVTRRLTPGVYDYGGALTLTDVDVSGSHATDGDEGPGLGGGVFVRGQGLTVSGSRVTGNTADSSGGAVHAESPDSDSPIDVEISTTTFGGHAANDANTARDGGGLSLGDAIALVTASTFAGNTALGSGGGITASGSTLTVRNSTITGNSGLRGGGLYLGSGGTIEFSTIASNVSGDPQDEGDPGSNIHAGPYSVSLVGSVVSNPLTMSGARAGGPANGADAPLNCSGPVDPDTTLWSVVSDDLGDSSQSSCGSSATGGIRVATVDQVALEALADNGGPTRTHRPGPGSVLIGGAPDDLGTGMVTDQRGRQRTGLYTVGSVQLNPAIEPVSQDVSGQTGSALATSPFTTQDMAVPVTYALTKVSGARTAGLPAGLSFDPATGVVSGTPTQVLPRSEYRVTATDASGYQASASIVLTIAEGPVTPTPTPSPTPAPVPPPKVQRPVDPLGLPATVRPSGTTRIVRLPVTTNADQDARVRVTCAPRAASLVPVGDTGPYCRVIRTAKAVKVRLSGERAVVIRVVITAPATDGYLPYRRTEVWRTRADR